MSCNIYKDPLRIHVYPPEKPNWHTDVPTTADAGPADRRYVPAQHNSASAMFTWCRSHSPIAVPCASEKHRIPSDPRVVLSQLSRASRRYSGRKTTQDCLRRSTLRTAGCCGSRSESSPQQRPCGAPGTRAPPGSIFQDAVRVRTRLRPRRRLGPGENDACERACVRPREPIEDGARRRRTQGGRACPRRCKSLDAADCSAPGRCRKPD